MMGTKDEVKHMSWKEEKIQDREIYRQDQEKSRLENH